MPNHIAVGADQLGVVGSRSERTPPWIARTVKNNGRFQGRLHPREHRIDHGFASSISLWLTIKDVVLPILALDPDRVDVGTGIDDRVGFKDVHDVDRHVLRVSLVEIVYLRDDISENIARITSIDEKQRLARRQ